VNIKREGGNTEKKRWEGKNTERRGNKQGRQEYREKMGVNREDVNTQRR
jgi:hypothetical protein